VVGRSGLPCLRSHGPWLWLHGPWTGFGKGVPSRSWQGGCKDKVVRHEAPNTTDDCCTRALSHGWCAWCPRWQAGEALTHPPCIQPQSCLKGGHFATMLVQRFPGARDGRPPGAALRLARTITQAAAADREYNSRWQTCEGILPAHLER